MISAVRRVGKKTIGMGNHLKYSPKFQFWASLMLSHSLNMDMKQQYWMFIQNANRFYLFML